MRLLAVYTGGSTNEMKSSPQRVWEGLSRSCSRVANVLHLSLSPLLESMFYMDRGSMMGTGALLPLPIHLLVQRILPFLPLE